MKTAPRGLLADCGFLTITTAALVVFLAALGFYGMQRYLVAAGRRDAPGPPPAPAPNRTHSRRKRRGEAQ